jgi:uncharacterized protein HemX
MHYENKIRVLEQELKQLEHRAETNTKDMQRMISIINELRILRRQQWEEDHERVNFDDER